MGTTEYVIILVVVLPIAALYDLMADKGITQNKVVWAVVIIGLPFLGPLLYLLTTRFHFFLKR